MDRCPNCGREMAAEETFCTACGTATPPATRASRLGALRVPLLATAALGLGLGAAALVGNLRREGTFEERPDVVVAASPAATAAGWVLCTDTVHHVAVSHPADWSPTPDGCVEFRSASEPEGTYLQLVPEVGPFDSVGIDGRVLARQDTTLGGRRAIRYESEYDAPDASTRRAYGLIIDRDGTAVALALVEAAERPRDEDRWVILERMAASLAFI